MADFMQTHGLRPHTADELNARLRAVIEDMPASLYGDPRQELTTAEQDVLREGGLILEPTDDAADPLADAAVRFAALLETSLTTAEAAERLDVKESHIRQMIARRALFSILLEQRRYIPAFQFSEEGALIPNITRINAALPEDLHPLDVLDWYTRPDPDLFLGDDVEPAMTPLQWLRTGGSIERLIRIARTL